MGTGKAVSGLPWVGGAGTKASRRCAAAVLFEGGMRSAKQPRAQPGGHHLGRFVETQKVLVVRRARLNAGRPPRCTETKPGPRENFWPRPGRRSSDAEEAWGWKYPVTFRGRTHAAWKKRTTISRPPAIGMSPNPTAQTALVPALTPSSLFLSGRPPELIRDHRSEGPLLRSEHQGYFPQFSEA